jgi:hypothetical protein
MVSCPTGVIARQRVQAAFEGVECSAKFTKVAEVGRLDPNPCRLNVTAYKVLLVASVSVSVLLLYDTLNAG